MKAILKKTLAILVRVLAIILFIIAVTLIYATSAVFLGSLFFNVHLHINLFWIMPFTLTGAFIALGYKFEKYKTPLIILSALPLMAFSTCYFLMLNNTSQLYYGAKANYYLNKGNTEAHDKILIQGVYETFKASNEEPPSDFLTYYWATSRIGGQITAFEDILNQPKNFGPVITFTPNDFLEKLHERELCFFEYSQERLKEYKEKENKDDQYWSERTEHLRKYTQENNEKFPDVKIIRKPDGSCLYREKQDE